MLENVSQQDTNQQLDDLLKSLMDTATLLRTVRNSSQTHAPLLLYGLYLSLTTTITLAQIALEESQTLMTLVSEREKTTQQLASTVARLENNAFVTQLRLVPKPLLP